ncbi:pyridoxamine 5'-phosphate oxidase family protein [Maridesulfovibrio sp.]|uniref:pyridoxamine 5'-phosphate oxidase family protein n=1 Tax=Maridesulfovibrio sp. TaxID=2795000 RepID=UPI003BA9C127
MTKNEILKFINDNPFFFLATNESTQPRVRVMTLIEASDEQILFGTDKYKDVYEQLARNPLIEMCFYTSKGQNQVRVSGEVELVEDIEVKKNVVSTRPFLNGLIEKGGYDVLAIYRLKNGKATPWSLKTSYGEKKYIEL